LPWIPAFAGMTEIDGALLCPLSLPDVFRQSMTTAGSIQATTAVMDARGHDNGRDAVRPPEPKVFVSSPRRRPGSRGHM